MRAEVQQARAPSEARRIEERELSAGGEELAKERPANSGADAVDENPHLDPGTRAVDEQVADLPARRVVVPDVELEVNMVERRGDVTLDGEEGLGTRVELGERAGRRKWAFVEP